MEPEKTQSATAISCDPSDEAFRLEDWPLYWITRVSRHYAMDLDRALKRVGMDLARWRVLMILQQFGPVSVSTIAEHAVIKLPTMTKTILRMAADGLVTTSPDKSDRRVTIVAVTELGAKATSKVRQQAGRLFQTAFSDVTAEESSVMTVTLKKILSNLTNVPG